MKSSILILTILMLTIILPVSAATHLPLGVPNTSPWVYAALPNQQGMDDLPVFNLTYLGKVNLAIGNIEYPPIYESNADVIPWQIWFIFVVIGVLGAVAAFAYPVPEGQVVASLFGMMFSGYAFILSSMIGFQNIASNPQTWTIEMGQVTSHVMPTVIQPVYTVYNPPWLWVIMLVPVFCSIAGLANGVYNLVMKNREQERLRRGKA